MPDPVLVTGAGGFIGSHLVDLLLETGHEVRAFVHYNSSGRPGWLERDEVNGRIDLEAGDVRDLDGVNRAMEGCRSVFHLAALIGIPYSYRSPLAYVRTNIEGTYNVLEAARRLGVNKVVVTSTSETYGTAQYVPIDEDHPSRAQSPYAATKVGADQLARSYHCSFDLPVWIVRPFNTFGPRQSARAFIPSVIAQIQCGRGHVKVGSLEPTRDLTYVRDTVAGMLAVAGCEPLMGSVTNIGTGREVSMGTVLEQIAALMGVEVRIQAETERVRPDASEVMRLVCDNGRLREHTGWTPQWDLDAGLEATIRWMARQPHVIAPERYHI